MAKLHPEEIEQYRAEGWAVPRFRLPEARVAAMSEALETLLRENPGVRPEKLVSAHVEGDTGFGQAKARHHPALGAVPFDLVGVQRGHAAIVPEPRRSDFRRRRCRPRRRSAR